jgi:hypothetical protein
MYDADMVDKTWIMTANGLALKEEKTLPVK